MNREWKIFATFVGVFLFAYFVPLATPEFSADVNSTAATVTAAIVEAFMLLQWYANLDQELLDEDPELAEAYEKRKVESAAYPFSESAQRGEYLFFGNKAWCSACHNGVNFTDELYHNTGIGLDADNPDPGRYEVTDKAEDWGTFRTPTIRGAVFTAPYMHDGSVRTLEEVVEWYAQEGRANRNLDYRYRRVEGEELSDQDKQDLVEFIRACSGTLPIVETGRLPE